MARVNRIYWRNLVVFFLLAGMLGISACQRQGHDSGDPEQSAQKENTEETPDESGTPEEPAGGTQAPLPGTGIPHGTGLVLALSTAQTGAAQVQETYSAFTDQGHGMFVWHVETGGGDFWNYSLYNPQTDSWSPAVKFAGSGESISLRQLPLRKGSSPLVSNGSSLALAWVQENLLQVMLVSPLNTIAPVKMISTPYRVGANDRFAITTLNGNYYIAWISFDGLQLYSLNETGGRLETLPLPADNPLSSAAWITATANSNDLLLAWVEFYRSSGEQHVRINSYVYHPDDPGSSEHTYHLDVPSVSTMEPTIAATGSGFTLAWIITQSDGQGVNRDLYADHYLNDGLSAPHWSTPDLLDSGIRSTGWAIPLAARDQSYMLVWQKTEGAADHVYYSTAAAGAGAIAGWLPAVEMFPGLEFPIARDLVLQAGNDGSFMAIWNEGSRLSAASFSAGQWRQLAALESGIGNRIQYVMDLQADTGGYKLVWREGPLPGPGPENIVVNRWRDGAWQDRAAFETPATFNQERTYAALRVAHLGDDYRILWTERNNDEGGTYLFNAVYDGAPGKAQPVNTAGLLGSNAKPRLFHSNADTSVALWSQYDSPDWDLTAAYRVGGQWSAPYKLSHGSNGFRPGNAADPIYTGVDTAPTGVNGDRILSAWYSDRKIQLQDMRGPNPPQLAVLSAETQEAWMYGQVHGVVPWRDTFVICWQKTHSTLNQSTLMASFEENGVWVHHEVASVDYEMLFSGKVLIMSDDHFAVFWKELSGPDTRNLMRRDWQSGSWNDAAAAVTLPARPVLYKLTADASGDILLLYGTDYNPQTQTQAALHSRLYQAQNSSWTEVLTLPIAGTNYSLASRSYGFDAFSFQGTGVKRSAYVKTENRWQVADVLAEPTVTYGNRNTDLYTLAHDGDTTLVVWIQDIGAGSTFYSRLATASGLTQPAALPFITGSQLSWPHLSATSEGYALTWAGAGTDSDVSDISAYFGISQNGLVP